MKFRVSLVVLLSVAALSLGLAAGCGQKEQTGGGQTAVQPPSGDQQAKPVNPHDVPITEDQKQQMREQTAKFSDAVAFVKQLRDAVERETNSGIPANPFEAHQALDKADIVVQWLPEIARNSNVPKEKWETVTTAANELRELFDKIHLNIDKKANPDFASVQQKMDARIAELEAIAQ
ncbi:MAG TPA: hypothetical protein VJL29_15970 [Thermoguttaceae bacterium]|nr:hypothetical protein [Thermoguttaceae bacterium]